MLTRAQTAFPDISRHIGTPAQLRLEAQGFAGRSLPLWEEEIE
jgi:hypothetical protein